MTAYKPIRQFQDQAICWLLKSAENMVALLEMIVPEVAKVLEADSLEIIDSKLIGENLLKTEEDIVYKAKLRHQKGDLIEFFVIVAHQSTKDPLMAFRLGRAREKFWEHELRQQSEKGVHASKRRLVPVVPLVISTCEYSWAVPRIRDLVPDHPALRPFLPDFELGVLDLASMGRAELLGHQKPLALILGLFQAEKQKEGFNRLFKETLAGLKELSSGAESFGISAWFCLQFAWHRRAQSEWPNLSEIALEFLEKKEFDLMDETMMTSAQWFEAKGHKVGLKEGQAKGLKEGREEGLKEGLKEGQAKGLKEGQAKGLKEGQAKGLKEGREEGLKEGQAKGRQEGLRQSILGFVGRLFPEASETETQERLKALDNPTNLQFILNRAFDWSSYEDVWTLPETD